MLSAIILAFDRPGAAPSDAAAQRERTARSLASLVDACVQGLIADATVVGPPQLGLDKVADEAGSGVIETLDARAGLTEALQAARYPHVFALAAGHAVERGFVEEVADLLAYGDLGRAHLLRAAPDSFITRLAPGLAAPVGIVAIKSAAIAARAADIAALAKKLRAVDLSSRARRVL
jgi:hypothetical protein